MGFSQEEGEIWLSIPPEFVGIGGQKGRTVLHIVCHLFGTVNRSPFVLAVVVDGRILFWERSP